MRPSLPGAGTSGASTPRALVLTALVLASALAGCAGLDGEEPGFVDVGPQAGLTYEVDSGLPQGAHAMAFLGGGLAVGDVDGDGWPDIYVADSGSNALYLNQGDGTFADRTATWGVSDDGIGRGVALFDYDNDGDLDLFVGNFASQSRMYENKGQTLVDVTEEAGVEIFTTVATVAVADVDGNGYLDIFVGVYGDMGQSPPSNVTRAENGKANVLLLNQGDGTFVDASQAWGLNHTRWTLAAVFSDLDLDGDQDLYVANDFGLDALYINDGERLEDRAAELGVEVDRNGMGANALDHDGDGDLDLYVTNIYVPDTDIPSLRGNVLLEATGDGYEDVSEEAGVADGGWSWDAEDLDIDNDGDLDLYVTNGFISRGDFDLFYDVRYELKPIEDVDERGTGPSGGYGAQGSKYNQTHRMIMDLDTVPEDLRGVDPGRDPRVSQGGYQTDRLFVNDGTGVFEQRAEELGAALPGDGRAAAYIDHDQDGDLDLVVTAAREPVRLLENNLPQGHYLQVELDPGQGRPADAIDAVLEATVDGRELLRVQRGASGFMSQNEPIVHFGLGEATQVDKLVITWPWGETTELENIQADQRITVSP